MMQLASIAFKVCEKLGLLDCFAEKLDDMSDYKFTFRDEEERRKEILEMAMEERRNWGNDKTTLDIANEFEEFLENE